MGASLNRTVKNFKEKSQKRVIIYCRESRDDYLENYDRIETQKNLLINYCKNKGYINIIDIIMHDNMTGTDFSRLDELKERIRRGEVDILVMKDSSRLGRNQLEALSFMQFLKQNNTEIEFQGKAFDPDFFPIEAWFNELRAKDDSKKIRTNLKHKMEEGELLIRAHYGYKKEGKKLLIDENSAWVVKKIFDLYKQGYGYRAIAARLNEEKIPTPSAYRNNSNRPIANTWIAQHIGRILKNEVYIGTMVSGKTEKISYKDKKIRRKPKDEWIKIENHHNPIIDKDTFKTVQNMISQKEYFAPKSKKPALLSGFIYCGRCGSPLYMIRKKGRLDSFICGKYFKEGKIKEGFEDRGCTSHRIKEADINRALKEHIKNMLNNCGYRKYFNSTLKDTKKQKTDGTNMLKRLEDSLAKFRRQYEQIYTDRLEGIIPEFLFQNKSKELNRDINIIEKRIYESKKSLGNLNRFESNTPKMDIAMESIEEQGLLKEDLSLLLNKIIVYDKHEINDKDKGLYNIDDITYNQIYCSGGIIVDMLFNVQYVMAIGWL